MKKAFLYDLNLHGVHYDMVCLYDDSKITFGDALHNAVRNHRTIGMNCMEASAYYEFLKARNTEKFKSKYGSKFWIVDEENLSSPIEVKVSEVVLDSSGNCKEIIAVHMDNDGTPMDEYRISRNDMNTLYTNFACSRNLSEVL